MKVAAITNAFGCARWLPGAVRQFAGRDIRQTILCNVRSWNGDLANDHETVQTARDLVGDTIIGDWTSAQEQFNWGLERCEQEGYDWVLLADADERWTHAGVGALLDTLERTGLEVARPWLERRYWKTPEWLIRPDPTDLAYVAFRPHVRVQNIRWPGPISWAEVGAELHHFSYVRTDEEMLLKITANDDYRGRDRARLEQWYQEKWLGWTPETEDLHPVVPAQFKRAVPSSAPFGLV